MEEKTILSLQVNVVNGFKTLGLLMADPVEKLTETHSTDQPTTHPQPTGDFHHSVTDSLQVNTTDCTNPYLSLTTSTLDKGKLLTFTSNGDRDLKARKSHACQVYLTSHVHSVIWAVLLEHNWCGGGVLLLLWEGTKYRRWNVCSVWHSPGPDMLTSINVVGVTIELNDIIEPLKFTLYVRAVKPTPQGQLELHFLSAKEGEFVFSCLTVRL